MAEVLAVDVAVVGGGPAGLAAALSLRRNGVARVAVLERERTPGGAVRHCGHPTFGVLEFGRPMSGPAYARRLAERARRAGAEVLTGWSVVALHPGGRLSVATPEGGVEVTARRVVLATGARETPRSARLVSGERPLGIVNTGALQACIYLEGLTPFRRPLVVGTELVGQSALWTCLSHGVRPVAVVEGAARPVARWPAGLFPRLLGVPAHYGARILDIRGVPRTEAVEIETASGARREIACDGVLFTGAFTPEAALLRAADLAVDGAGGAEVNPYGRCSDPAYYAAGNLLRAVETAPWCWREGLRIGRTVAQDLGGRAVAASPRVAIRLGAGLKSVTPQRLVLPLSPEAIEPLQVRAAAASTGRLTLRADGRALWSRRMTLRPERRILVPRGALRGLGEVRDLTLSVETG